MSRFLRSNFTALPAAGLFICLFCLTGTVSAADTLHTGADAGNASGGITSDTGVSSETETAITISDAFNMALSTSEELASRKEGIKQLEAAEKTIKSSFRPSLNLNGIHYKYRNEHNQTNVWFSASYTLFSGMRDYILLKASHASMEAGEMELAAAKRALFLDVVSAYLNLYRTQKENIILKNQIKVVKKRIDHLKWRVSVGRSRRSEVVAAETQLAQTEAEYTGNLASEQSCIQTLSFLTGMEDVHFLPAEPAAVKAMTLGEYLKKVESREDILAAAKKADAAAYTAEAENRKAMPEVALSGNYYPLKEPMPAQDRLWYAALEVSVPLYTGGKIAAGKESAMAARNAAGMALRQALRSARNGVRTAYSDYEYAGQRYKTLKKAARLARENVRLQEEDYSKMLVTNLDVLSAMNTAQSAETALLRAEIEMLYAFYKLENISGAPLK